MQDIVQKVPFVIVREGEESMNIENYDRYQHSKDKDASERKVHSLHHSVGIHHGNEKPELRSYHYPRRHLKIKRDGNALHG